MLIRFIAKNIYSFREQTEFNLLSSSKTESLSHHKIKQEDVTFLRYSAIYGGNGVGKSNLIKTIALLEDMVVEGKSPKIKNIKFRMKDGNNSEPVSLGIEFLINKKVFFYTITFDEGLILYEYLVEILNGKEDKLVFERNIENGIQKINFGKDFNNNDLEYQVFLNAFSKLIPKNKLTIYFLAKNYSSDFKEIESVYDWFDKDLVIITPSMRAGALPHILDVDKKIKSFANNFISNLNLGISDVSVDREEIEKSIFSQNEDLMNEFSKLKEESNKASSLIDKKTGEEIIILSEKGKIYSKRIVTYHNGIKFSIGEESDGTRRLFDYIPALHSIINKEKVYIIDEIERSIHPLLIKEIISKLTLNEDVKGQLIFTTHETNLLNQSILRPDEIWLTEKNKEGVTEIYPLSDFKIHNTISIENGYLSGRYGGIPILSNLKDLNW